ncbi:MAG: hypothetical protein ACM3Q1_13945 [Bacteroidales bacterium]
MQSLLFEVFVEFLGYPVRDAHPLVVAVYYAALLATIVGLCLLVRHFIPADPFR